jgi:hypothetical protein
MRRASSVVATTMLLLGAGCAGNTAVGNDREAELDPHTPPAPVMAAGAALQGITTNLVIPQVMTDADLGNVPDVTNRCVFRMTRVGEPVVVYGTQAVLKLNDKLVPLPTSGAGRYAADGVTVTVRPLDDGAETEGRFDAEFVLQLPGAPDELGYHGFSEC